MTNKATFSSLCESAECLAQTLPDFFIHPGSSCITASILACQVPLRLQHVGDQAGKEVMPFIREGLGEFHRLFQIGYKYPLQ